MVSTKSFNGKNNENGKQPLLNNYYLKRIPTKIRKNKSTIFC